MSAFKPVKFGKYLLLEKLATGGMAQLFKGKMIGVEGFEKLVAIKQILPHLVEEKEFINSFVDEAKLAAMLHHQNIVQIYDFGNMEGTYYIAMEYLQGRDLRMIVNRAKEINKPLHLEQILFIMSHICSGLDYAHKMKDYEGKPLNIIHRDISPQNIMITYEGEVKILDFGIAKAATKRTMTQMGMIKGKVAYMSPEQAAGKIIDYRSDIFSTGILFYELVTGRRVFTGETMQILANVRDAEFEPVEAIIKNLPPGIYKMLNRVLAKEPDQRYQSCKEMLSDIEACMFGPDKIDYSTKLREGVTGEKEGMTDPSLMPTASGLARYMKELFGDDQEKDLEVFRNTGEIRIADDHTNIKDSNRGGKAEVIPAAEKPQEKIMTQPLVEEPVKDKKKLPLFYIGLGIAVVLIAIIAVSVFRKKPAIVQDNTIKPSVSESSEMPAAEKATSESAGKPDPVPAPATKAKELLEQAIALKETQAEEAKSMLLEVVKLDPQSAKGHFHLGIVFMKLKDYPQAIETFKKSAVLDPQSPDTFFNLGYIYAINKEYPKAEEMYKQVVKLSPSYLDEALFNLGIVQDKQGKREQCIENLERALKVNPKNRLAFDYLARLKGKS